MFQAEHGGLVSITSPSDSVLELKKKTKPSHCFITVGGIEAKRSWDLLKEIIITIIIKGLIRSVYTEQKERWR